MSEEISWKENCFSLFTEGLDNKAKQIIAENIPKSLFKYYRLTEHTLENLSEDKIWLSNPQYYNDPYDSLIQEYFSFGKFNIENDIISLIISSKLLNASCIIQFKERLFANNKSINEIVDSFLLFLNNLMLSACEYDKNIINSIVVKIKAMRINAYSNKIMNHLFEKLYLTCFSEKKDDILMWSHYCDSNRGLCVEYDKEGYKQKMIDETIDLLPVIYRDEIFSYGSYSNCRSPFPQIIVKNNCWKYEAEWRIIKFGILGNRGIKQTSPKINRIILGSNFNFSEKCNLKNKLIKIIKEKKIVLCRMKPENYNYKLNEYPLKI